MKRIKDTMPAPKRRSGYAVAAMHRKGAGAHKLNNRKEEPMCSDTKLTLKEFRQEYGIESGTDMQTALEEWTVDSVVPAMCKEGCEVEPDGECEHGNPSILIRMGVI